MIFTFFTLFPELCDAGMKTGVIGNGVEKGLLKYQNINFRNYTHDKHQSVDDTPYGGGPGMVLKAEPIIEAVEDTENMETATLILLTPQGKTFDQKMAQDFSRKKHIAFICGRYEGIDERVRLILKPEEISIGDYVMTGGELAALAIADCVGRLVPGVLGDEHSAEEESFSTDIAGLEYPQYTKPREVRSHAVPEILLGGNHAEIKKWRHECSKSLTKNRRPDLISATP